MTVKSSLFQADKLSHTKPYQQQLADKKSHLLAAKNCLQESARLIQQYQDQIAAKEYELAQLYALELVNTNEYEQQISAENIRQAQQFIAAAPANLAPYLVRFEQLKADIEQFETDIRELIQQIQQVKSDAKS